MRTNWKKTACLGILFAAMLMLLARTQAAELNRIHLRASQRPVSGRTLSGAGGYVPYHNGTTLVCSDCHTMHASAQHDYAGEGSAFSAQPHSKLLKAGDPALLCLSCHDGTPGVPDVVGADSNGLTERSAGFFDTPDTPNYKGHKLGTGLTSDQNYCLRCHFEGEFATASVTCTDCHNPHGNNNARNLQWVSWPGAEPTFGLLENPSATGMAKYERSNVAYATMNSDALREVSNICIDCHHSFSGSHGIDPNYDGFHERHPSYDSERSSPNNILQGAARGVTNPDHWLGGIGSGFTGAARVPFMVNGASDFAGAMVVDPNTNGVFCLSCHKAHGGAHAFGLTWQTEDGIGPRGCDQCHGERG